MDAVSPSTLTDKMPEGECEDKPYVKSVKVPESIKRRIPSKHYVYKVVVNWSSGKQIIIYRKYSLFFDFVFKLNQLLSELPPDVQKGIQMPELPGRVLFGRTEVHQVAEKRRRKIEEFCQKLIELPEEVSHSSLVLGFFNTWPADTLLRRPSLANTHVITAPIIEESSSSIETSRKIPIRHSSSSSSSSVTGSTTFSPPTHETGMALHQQPEPARSPSPLLSPQSQSDFSALEAIITHPDEMENLEQYLVLADYERKDSHQVNLKANQHVYVIEKHDTGWWMVMSEDEQGYAPASYLEPVEGQSSKDEHLDEGAGQVYEAMESYFAENDDEITIKAGDRIEVISKSMDGWWMIRCNGRTGLSPAALIRRRQSSSEVEEVDEFETEKDIYEGLNIHRPPPRRSTIGQSKRSKVPINYDIPRSHSNKKKLSKTTAANKKNSSEERAGLLGSLTSSSVDFVDKTDHIYETEFSEPYYESTSPDDNGPPRPGSSIYENTEFMKESVKRKTSSPANLSGRSKKAPVDKSVPARHKSISEETTSKKKLRHSPDDYEDPDGIMDEDYIDMDGDTDNMYIDPEDLRKGNIDSSCGSPETELAPTAHQNGTKGSDGVLFDDDYIEMDPLYTEPPLESDDENDGTLKASSNATKSSPKQSPVSKRPLPPPPYSSPTPKEEDKKGLTRAKSLEDIIASFNSRQNGNKTDSPETKPKKVAPNPPPRVQAMSSSSSSSSVSNSSEQQTKSSKIKLSARKLIGGGSKKKESSPLHDKVAAVKSQNTPLERSTSPSGSEGVSGHIPRPPLIHTQSTPNMEPHLPKTYVSIASYTSPAKECLSFSEGDKCVLIQESPDGWWLVNIGGREGWTPGEYWKEDIRDSNIPKPPSFAAPRKAPYGRKSRSQTVNDVFAASVELPSSLARSGDNAEEDHRNFNRSIDVLSSPSKATPSPISSSGTRSKKGPIRQTSDPRIKPNKPMVPHKPTVPSKPSNLKQSPRTSPTPSSPSTNRKKPGDTPSPPPQLIESKGMDSRDVGSMAMNGHGGVRECSPVNDYEQLDEISTIEGSPWYCGKMERTQAEQYLMEHGRQREFLIRERTNKTGFYALSVRYHFSCKHFNIDPSPDGQYVMGVLTFPSIEHIILHYQQNSLFIYDGQHVTLSQPVKKRSRHAELSRHNH